jgi:putative tricarboxylic transport membrane protein
MSVLATAFEMVFSLEVLLAMVGAALFGLFVGAVPGLTATMATALLVPVTFFLPPIPAVAVMVTATAMAIFAGDIPGCLLRIPGTPASAAYVDESYAMTQKGQAQTALGVALVSACLGGLFGTAVLIVAAPSLAEVALQFSSYEYFWLVLLGLTCAVFVSGSSPLKGMVTLLLGLLLSGVGLQNPAAHPRFTFGNTDLLGGISLIPAMIGLFAISEILRFAASREDITRIKSQVGSVFKGLGAILYRYKWQGIRGSALGTGVGALPGAGADIAAWVAYAISRKSSKTKEKFGTGHPEGLVEAGSANSAALSAAWIPALVFGIPGDSITAIVIGVLYMKNINPGPMIFINNPESIYAVFLIFILASLLLLPLGWLCIKTASTVLRTPRRVLMPIILMFCLVGAFAINNSPFDLWVLIAFGMLGWFLESHGFPVAPAILGLLLGSMLEEHFVTSMIKADGDFWMFIDRPIAMGLAALTVLVWTVSIAFGVRRSLQKEMVQ